MLLAFVVIFMMFGLIAVYTYVSYASLRPKDGTICEGVTVEHVAVGGMTKDQAMEAVSEETEKRGRQVLEVEVNGSVVTTTLAEVGYTFSAEEFLDEAMKVGRRGNLIENYKEIKSPMVGTFYSSPSPKDLPYVKVGDKVKKGDVLCVVEAMKLMNEIESEYDGEIVEICVENEDMVEYGTTLFKIK